jgi:predicted nucleic acid-binding Zn ribbon protein
MRFFMLERPPRAARRRVTALRNISGKFSGSRNAGGNLSEYDPDACFYCGRRFDRGQMRYPIRNFDWGADLVSVCVTCFKEEADFDVTSRQPRYERQCNGCGEPIMTPTYGVLGWQICSRRCYQRTLRKRHRREKSRCCKVCKKRLEPTRKDARFCSNACRQFAYRARQRPGPNKDG